MLLTIKSANPPPRIPKTNCPKATDPKLAPCRARRPSEAEEKIKKPAATKIPIIIKSMVSTERGA